jgi:hypothetical protein
MNEKMQVIFFKQTFHALAAFTRTADPEGMPSIENLVGDGIEARNKATVPPPATGTETLLVPAASLDVAVVDFEDDVFTLPLGFAVSGSSVTPISSNVTVTASLTATKLTITVSLSSPNELKVWAQVAKVLTLTDTEPDGRIIKGKIDANQTFVDLSLTIVPDGPAASIATGKDYYVLALVEGLPPLFTTTKPV